MELVIEWMADLMALISSAVEQLLISAKHAIVSWLEPTATRETANLLNSIASTLLSLEEYLARNPGGGKCGIDQYYTGIFAP